MNKRIHSQQKSNFFKKQNVDGSVLGCLKWFACLFFKHDVSNVETNIIL